MLLKKRGHCSVVERERKNRSSQVEFRNFWWRILRGKSRFGGLLRECACIGMLKNATRDIFTNLEMCSSSWKIALSLWAILLFFETEIFKNHSGQRGRKSEIFVDKQKHKTRIKISFHDFSSSRKNPFIIHILTSTEKSEWPLSLVQV